VDWSKDEVHEVWTGDVHQPTSGPYWLKPYGFAIFRP